MFIFLSITIINCSDDTVSPVVDDSDFRYPFTDGSSWDYKRTITVSDIRPDSILSYFSDYPIEITGTVTILYDTVINSVLTKCFLDEFTYLGMPRSNRFYYINNDTAFILYTTRSHPASGLFPLSIFKNTNILLSEVSRISTENSNDFSNAGDSLPSTLKYPVATGTEWSFTNEYATVTRKYLGFEIVPTSGSGNISCMKMKTTNSVFPDDPIYNYYSKFGLMKRTSSINDVTFSTASSPEGIGTIDINDDSEILSFGIVSE